MLSPIYGLVDGFDLAEWGEWWEQVHRLKSGPSHVYGAGSDGRTPEFPGISRRERAGRALKTTLTRVPSVLAVSESVMRHTLDPDRRWVGNMNPWVEPELSRWLARQPADQPTFCFINFLDAHEPYLLDPMAAESLRDWWRFMKIPQDILALLADPTPPPPNDLAKLHELYRKAIVELDRRLERIVDIYRAAGRWQNALLLLTSDHGQAFGEHGMMWHGVRTDEEMLRVPLVLRLPNDELAGSIGAGWATPMDALPTVLEAAHIRRAEVGSAVSLRSLIGAPRPTALLSAGDGTEWNRPFMHQLSPRRRIELNQFSVAAYIESVKIVVDAISGAVRGYELSSDTATELPAGRLGGPELAPVIQQARQAASSLLHPSSTSTSIEVDERLRSWGYG